MKKILSIILALVLVLGLAACGGSKKGTPEATIDTLMEGLKTMDFEKIKGTMKDATDEDMDLAEDESIQAMYDILKGWASKLTYKLGKSEVNGDKATVAADVTYTDAADLISEAFTEYISTAMSKAFSGEEVSEEEMQKLLMDTINEKAKSVGTKTAEASLTFNLEKVGDDWKIVDPPEDIANIMLSNMINGLEGMFDGLIDMGD